MKIVKWSDVGKFTVLPRRWVVEGTLLAQLVAPSCHGLGKPGPQHLAFLRRASCPSHGSESYVGNARAFEMVQKYYRLSMKLTQRSRRSSAIVSGYFSTHVAQTHLCRSARGLQECTPYVIFQKNYRAVGGVRGACHILKKVTLSRMGGFGQKDVINEGPKGGAGECIGTFPSRTCQRRPSRA